MTPTLRYLRRRLELLSDQMADIHKRRSVSESSTSTVSSIQSSNSESGEHKNDLGRDGVDENPGCVPSLFHLACTVPMKSFIHTPPLTWFNRADIFCLKR